MAKLRRKISPSQRNKVAIETAKILKKKGVLSKQAKLHGGRHISPKVLRKVQEYQHAAKPHYTAVKVSKAIARQAKEEGYQVVQGNRVIVPKEHDFIKRVKKGMIAGMRPVKGGFMSEVKLPFNPSNYDELLALLENENIDDMKLPHERFAFQVGGDQMGGVVGMSYRSFSNGQEIRKYLQHYRPDVFIAGLKFFRLHPEDERQFIIGKQQRDRITGPRKSGQRYDDKGNIIYRSKRGYMERLEKRNPKKAAQVREASRVRSKERYQEQKNDPAYMERARKRALKSYENRRKK